MVNIVCLFFHGIHWGGENCKMQLIVVVMFLLLLVADIPAINAFLAEMKQVNKYDRSFHNEVITEKEVYIFGL